MNSDIERTIVRELDDIASNLVVPPLPDLGMTSPGRRRVRAVHGGRRHGLVPLLVAAAVIVLVVGVALGTPRHREPPQAASPSPTQHPASAAPRLIPYDGDGSHPRVIRSSADANTLAGAPQSFKEFIGRTADRLAANKTCGEGSVGVRVRALRTDGYAVGSVNGCDDHVAMWAIVDGHWKEIDATLDLWDCAVLAEYRVPSDIAGDSCYDDGARAQRSYQHD